MKFYQTEFKRLNTETNLELYSKLYFLLKYIIFLYVESLKK